jgi:hypothetical protein
MGRVLGLVSALARNGSLCHCETLSFNDLRSVVVIPTLTTPEPSATPNSFVVIDKEPAGTGANVLSCAEQEPPTTGGMA